MRYLCLILLVAVFTACLSGSIVTINDSHIEVRIDSFERDNFPKELSVSFGSFSTEDVKLRENTYKQLSLANEPFTTDAGEPELPYISRSIIIPSKSIVTAEVIKSEYRDYSNIDIVPSRGLLYRNQNLSDIPYRFSETYQTDEFYPSTLVEMQEPFIIRDFRGQTVTLYPFQYNPVTRTLRVHYQVTIQFSVAGTDNRNILTDPVVSYTREFREIYENLFLNFDESRYDPLPEVGRMIVIAYDSFISEIQPFVDWKNQKGIPTELFPLSEVGLTSAAIKSFIQNQYNQDDGLVFVQLVGDAAQIPTFSHRGGGSDPTYSLLAGNDNYPDIFVGRFSAETVSQVETQVSRTINYERDIQTENSAWLSNGTGIASNEGSNPSDIEHMNSIRDMLLGYNYETIDRIYAPNATSTQVTNSVNQGRGFINYAGHGTTTGWTTSSFNNNRVNELTNTGKLPFILSVACINGNFTGSTCFAETWLRATDNITNEPTGAVAMYASSVNQTWYPPLTAQYETTNILTNELSRTIGGIFFNGAIKMIEAWGNGGADEFKNWHIFGDASLLVRTDSPDMISVSCNSEIEIGQTVFPVQTDVTDALVSLTNGENKIIGFGYTNHSGEVTLVLDPYPTQAQVLNLTVTAYNRVTSISQIDVVESLDREVTIGEGDLLDNNLPLNFYFKNSLSQTVYSSEEIGITGTIRGVTYYNSFTSNLAEKELRIWIGEIDQDNLSGGWIPATDLEEAFDGLVDFPSGANSVTINFDTPYQYTGQNLVIMVQRPMDNDFYSSNDKFYATDSTVANRSRYRFSDSIILDPNNPNGGSLSSIIPNTTLRLGNTSDFYGLLVTPNSLSGSGYANSVVQYELMVRNTGSFPDSYSLSANDNNWDVSFWFDPSFRTYSQSNHSYQTENNNQPIANYPSGLNRETDETGVINPGETRLIGIRVNVPEGTVEEDSATVVIQSTNDSDIVARISLNTQSLGYNPDLPSDPVRFIAEFEPSQGVLIRYPLGIPYELVKDLSEHTTVYTLVGSESLKNQAFNYYQSSNVNLSNCEFFVTPTDSWWSRDYGPWFVTTGNREIGVVDFEYNRNRPQDNQIPSYISNHFSLNRYNLGLVHTGGNIMTDGMGIAASTDLVLTENSNLTQQQVNERMNRILGIDEYLLHPDPTSSTIDHIDTWAKFLAVDKLMIRSVSPGHPRYTQIENAVQYFSDQTSSYGTPYQVFRVYTPNNEPYVNALIVNNKVYVPQMNNANDEAALESFRQAMPGYEVAGFTGSWISDDSIHCRVIGIADLEMLHIAHIPVKTHPSHSNILIEADIIAYSGAELVTESPVVKWRNSADGDFNQTTLSHYNNITYRAYLPAQDYGDFVEYYISASDYSGRTEFQPYVGAADPHKIEIDSIGELDRPENLTIDISRRSITLSWDSVAGAVAYRVESSDSSSDFSSEYSSANFSEEGERVFWNTEINGQAKFFRVIALGYEPTQTGLPTRATENQRVRRE